MESATKKQKNYARDISELLKIPLPEQDDLTAYSEFIETHIREYHKEKRRKDENEETHRIACVRHRGLDGLQRHGKQFHQRVGIRGLSR